MLYRVQSAAAAKSLQSCPTLCDPIDGSPPGSPVPGILQARTLQWVAISFSNAWKWKVKVKSLSSVRLLATPRTTAYQAPPSMGFSRQEYWSGVPLPSPNQQHSTCLFLHSLSQCLAISWINVRLIVMCHWYWPTGYMLQVFRFVCVCVWLFAINMVGCINSLFLPPWQSLTRLQLFIPMSCSQVSSRNLTLFLTPASPVSRMGVINRFKFSTCHNQLRNRRVHKVQTWQANE